MAGNSMLYFLSALTGVGQGYLQKRKEKELAEKEKAMAEQSATDKERNRILDYFEKVSLDAKNPYSKEATQFLAQVYGAPLGTQEQQAQQPHYISEQEWMADRTGEAFKTAAGMPSNTQKPYLDYMLPGKKTPSISTIRAFNDMYNKATPEGKKRLKQEFPELAKAAVDYKQKPETGDEYKLFTRTLMTEYQGLTSKEFLSPGDKARMQYLLKLLSKLNTGTIQREDIQGYFQGEQEDNSPDNQKKKIIPGF